MKMELVVAHDFALFGKKRDTGTVFGAFDMPDAAKSDVAGMKLKNAVANGHLEFRVVKAKDKDKGKAGKGE